TADHLTGLQVRAVIPPRAGTSTLPVSVDIPWSVQDSVITLGPMAAGHYQDFCVEGPAVRRLRFSADVVADRTTDVGSLKLELLASIETRVTDATGAPLGDAEFHEDGDLRLPAGRILS